MLAAGFPRLGIGFAGVAVAFGLTLLAMAYTIGPISGCHINPAVSFGLWAGGRFPGREVAPYVMSQVLGGILAASVLYVPTAHRTSAFMPTLPPTVTVRIRRAATVSALPPYARP